MKSILVDGKKMDWQEIIDLAKEQGYKGKRAFCDNNAKAGAIFFLRNKGSVIELRNKGSVIEQK